MHSLAQRANTLSSIITTGVFIVMILVSILTIANPPILNNQIRFKSAKPIVSLKNTRNYGATKQKPKENAKFKFDMVADFNDLVDWNTKQVFAYVYVEIDNDDNNNNNNENADKIVIWDKIFDDKSKMYFNQKNIKSKYSLWDYSPELHGRTGTFKLGYNIQPHLGPLTFGTIDLNQTITFPEIKV